MNTAKAKMPQSYRNASRDWELAERRLIETKALFAELETIVAEEDRQNYRDQKRSESKRISDSLLEKGSVLQNVGRAFLGLEDALKQAERHQGMIDHTFSFFDNLDTHKCNPTDLDINIEDHLRSLAGIASRAFDIEIDQNRIEILRSRFLTSYNKLQALAQGRSHFSTVEPRIIAQHVDPIKAMEHDARKYYQRQRKRCKVS